MPYIFACCHSHPLVPWILCSHRCAEQHCNQFPQLTRTCYLYLSSRISASQHPTYSYCKRQVVICIILQLYSVYYLFFFFFPGGSISINEQATKLVCRGLKLNMCSKSINSGWWKFYKCTQQFSGKFSEELHFCQTLLHTVYIVNLNITINRLDRLGKLSGRV